MSNSSNYTKDVVVFFDGLYKIIVTDLRINKTIVIEDAKTYNSITIRKDSTFNIEQDYDMV